MSCFVVLLATCSALLPGAAARQLASSAEPVDLSRKLGHLGQLYRTEHEAKPLLQPIPANLGVTHGAEDYGSLQKYARCLLSPTFYVDDVEMGCPMMQYNQEEFKNVAEVLVDASRCRRFMPNGTDAMWGARREPPLKYVMHLRPKTTDWRVLLQVYCENHFHFILRLTEHMPPGRPMTFLDAGANIGAVTSLISQLLAFRGEVVSVEANPATADATRTNVQALIDVGLVSVLTRAMTSVPQAGTGKTLDFAGVPGEYWGYRILGVNETAGENWEVHRVQPVSIKDLMASTRSGRFDFIKLDIEGAELEIFEDVESTQGLCTASCLFLELHDFMRQGCEAAYRKFQERCPEHHYVGTFGEYHMTCRQSGAENGEVPLSP